MNVNFDCIFYYVSDLQRAIAFYGEVLGLKLCSRDVVARFELDGVSIELVPAQRKTQMGGTANARLCLRVDDIQAAIAGLRAKGVAASAAQPKQHGLLAAVHDPDGNEICLWQDVAPT